MAKVSKLSEVQEHPEDRAARLTALIQVYADAEKRLTELRERYWTSIPIPGP